MSEWAVLVNPNAGVGRHAERVESALEEWDADHLLEVPSSPDAMRGAVFDAFARGIRRFVAVGGDGTVNLVVDTLMRLDFEEPPKLGILPAGSGCDFIRTFGIPQDLEGAARHLSGDEFYRSDVGLISGAFGDRYFLNAANIGIAAGAAALAPRLPRWLGSTKYVLAFLMSLPRFRSTSVRLQLADKEHEGHAMSVVVANGQFFGGGLNIAPRATVVDGLFDVQMFSAAKRQAPAILAKVAKGTHLTLKAVRRWSVSELTVETERPWPVEVDGEYLGETPVSCRVRAGQIDIKI